MNSPSLISLSLSIGLALLLCACAACQVQQGSPSVEESSGDPTAGDDDDSSMPSSDQLVGNYPKEALSLPSFSATNSDGSPRSGKDLVGHPTVLWFFPFAGTPL